MTNYSFMELLKISRTKVDPSLKKVRLAILADSATQHLKTAIMGYGRTENISIEVFDADYDQIDLQIYNDESELYQFMPDIVLLFMCTQKLHEAFCKQDDRAHFCDRILEKTASYHRRIHEKSHADVLQFLFVERDDRIYGNFGLGLETSFIYQIKSINLGMMRAAASDKKLYLIDPNSMEGSLNEKGIEDPAQYCNTKMAFSLESLPEAAHMVIDIVKAKLGKVKKAVIVDLDNTLWGGVIGDDGLEGIEIGELGIGHAFCDFQRWLLELKRRGILLCVCSKNTESTAKEPFEKHPDMVLRLEDFAMFVANWEDKASNIRHIQETLNIGMDSFVFVDDNPFERELVRSMIPEITVPDMPEDPALYCTYLQGLNLFETISASENDEVRTKQYQEEVGRSEHRREYNNFDDYLVSLEMRGRVCLADKYAYPRIAQLTQRSNQFNLRTVRYTEGDIERLAANPDYWTLYFTLEDRFGDYGLVSVIILRKWDNDTVFVDTWLMSCRVLKRGMEEFVANSVIACAKENGFKKVRGEYIPTPKNAMVEHLYDNFGFTKLEDGIYEIDVDQYVPKKHYIKQEGKRDE